MASLGSSELGNLAEAKVGQAPESWKRAVFLNHRYLATPGLGEARAAEPLLLCRELGAGLWRGVQGRAPHVQVLMSTLEIWIPTFPVWALLPLFSPWAVT